jgi:hypothetical protein
MRIEFRTLIRNIPGKQSREEKEKAAANCPTKCPEIPVAPFVCL